MYVLLCYTLAICSQPPTLRIARKYVAYRKARACCRGKSTRYVLRLEFMTSIIQEVPLRNVAQAYVGGNCNNRDTLKTAQINLE